MSKPTQKQQAKRIRELKLQVANAKRDMAIIVENASTLTKEQERGLRALLAEAEGKFAKVSEAVKVLAVAMERIATESDGLYLRYRHADLGELCPPPIKDIAGAALAVYNKDIKPHLPTE